MTRNLYGDVQDRKNNKLDRRIFFRINIFNCQEENQSYGLNMAYIESVVCRIQYVPII